MASVVVIHLEDTNNHMLQICSRGVGTKYNKLYFETEQLKNCNTDMNQNAIQFSYSKVETCTKKIFLTVYV